MPSRLSLWSQQYSPPTTSSCEHAVSYVCHAMSSHVCVFCVFQQYNPATTTEVETLLKTQKAENPGRIPYLMCRRGVPGYLNLLYIPGNRCDDD